jgi:glycosyltransferase involved in cell wall biosynthesis
LKELKKYYSEIRIITFKKNKGQSVALFAGFKAAKGRWIITLDADLQNPPEEIFKLLEAKDNFDLVIGIRKNRKDTFFRNISSLLARTVVRLLLGDTTIDPGCPLRIFKREILDSIPFFQNFHYFFAYLVKTRGFVIKEVYVKHDRRMFGESKYGILKRVKYGILGLQSIFWLRRRVRRVS